MAGCLAKAETKAKAQAAKSVDSMPPEWARDPSTTEQVTLYNTGMHLLTDNAYNDDRGKSFEDGMEDGGERSKASARRKQGDLISGRSAGRLAAARFLADADDTHPGKCSFMAAQNFAPPFFVATAILLVYYRRHSFQTRASGWQLVRQAVPKR